MNVLLSTAYWPNLEYFYYLLNAEDVRIEQFENFPKQSFRNRTRILSANGILDLSIPVKKHKVKEYTKDIRISYSEKWQANHWRAITSAYRNSPYFEYFEESISSFYLQEYEFLLGYNLKQIEAIQKLLKIRKEIKLTDQFEKKPLGFIDKRDSIHPKKQCEDPVIEKKLARSYYQTFENKFQFIPNLSILDLLFNQGLQSLPYLAEE